MWTVIGETQKGIEDDIRQTSNCVWCGGVYVGVGYVRVCGTAGVGGVVKEGEEEDLIIRGMTLEELHQTWSYMYARLEALLKEFHRRGVIPKGVMLAEVETPTQREREKINPC